MAVRTILRMGDPRLLEPAEPVPKLDTPDLHALVADLWETMEAYDGAGLAAPQVGIGLRVVVFRVDAHPRYPEAEAVPATTLVNPVLHPLSGERDEDWEGCLSLPGLAGLVPRHRRLRYTGFTPEGAPVDREVSGFHARVVQHECDHLDGILYPFRMPDLSRFGFVEALGGEPPAAE
ncbi:MAG TPA: peptide deformylase [Gammaproteobacteria bacterium]|nr:peptide deformylase [Gammaproteobacteria bacterium]